jgi:uracil-DNA glycosylase
MTRTQELWKSLDLLEDLIRFGERTDHPDPPDLPEPGAVVDAHAGLGSADAAVPAGGDLGARKERLAALEARVRSCTRCGLAQTRTKAVPGAGVLDPVVMVVGEGPGADEDRTGQPFVGRAGKYLDKWLAAIGCSRETNAYIANIVKCRPPGNRDPQSAESDACLPYLREQIQLVKPQAILTVGRIATSLLVGTTAGIGSLRGRTFYVDGFPLIPTYHPSGVLRNPELRKPVWDDLKRLAALAGLPTQ